MVYKGMNKNKDMGQCCMIARFTHFSLDGMKASSGQQKFCKHKKVTGSDGNGMPLGFREVGFKCTEIIVRSL